MADDKDLKEIDIAPSTLEDVDTATYNWLNEQLDVKTKTNKGFRKVPVQWVAGEKAFQMKSNPNLRDSSGALIMPMITIERSSVIKDPARKGTAYGNIPNRGDNKGGAITVARRIKQDKTGNFSNAQSRKRTGKLNFRTRKQEKVVYETITIPMPVYVEVTYSISLRAEYQQQMNDMVQPFITEPGGTNYLTVQNNNHSYEAFMESDFTLENTVSDMQGERSYETKIQLKVLAPLIGDGVNQETPKYVVRENAVDVKILREVSTLDSNYVPRRLTTPSIAGSFDITDDAAAAALPDVEMFVSPETITTEETGSSQFLGVRFNRSPELGTIRVNIVEQLDATEHEVDTAFLEFEDNFTQQKFFKFTGKPDTVQDADFTTEITIRATSVDDADFLLEKKVTLINKNLELFDVPQAVLIITEDATQTPSVSVPFKLNFQPPQDVTLTLTALPGLDERYTVGAQSLTFTTLDWQAEQNFVFQAIDDNFVNGNADFTLTVSSGTQEKNFTIQVVDNDTASMTVEPTEVITSEDVNSDMNEVAINVVLGASPAVGETVTISFSGLEPTEHSADTVQFTSDDWNQQKPITITGLSDGVQDGDQTYVAQLVSQSTNQQSTFHNISVDVTLTNLDTDVEAGVILLNTSDEVLEGDATQFDISEDGTTASFKLRLASQPSDEVTLSFADNPAGIGTEYSIEIDNVLLVDNSITFQPAQWNIPRVVKLVATDDSLVEDVETFTLTMTADGGGFQNVSRSVIVSITSDDTAGIQINNKPDFIDLDESDTAATVAVSVQLTSPPAANETITLSVTPPSDDFSTTQVDFTVDNWDNAQDITFTVTDDATIEAQEAFQVKIEVSSSSQDSAFAGVESEELTVRITDNDNRGIELADVSEQAIAGVPTVALNEFEDGDVIETINVRLTSQPTGQVTLDIADTNGDGVVGEEFAVMINSTLNESTQVVFDETNWNQFQQIMFSAIDDDDLEGDEQYNLTITASGADYEGGGIQREVTVTMEDAETIEIIATPLAVTTSEEETSGTIQVSLSHATLTDDVTIVIDDIDSAEHIASPETVTFTSDDDVTTQKTIQFTGVADPDGLDSADVSYQITLRTVSDDVRFNGKTKVIQLTNIDISPQVPATQFRFTGLEVQQFGSNVGEDTVFVFDVEGMDDSNFDTLMNYTADTFQCASPTTSTQLLQAGNGDCTAIYNQDFSKFTVTITTNTELPNPSGRSSENNFVGWYNFSVGFGANISDVQRRYVKANFRVHEQTFNILTDDQSGAFDSGDIINSENGFIFSPPKIPGSSIAAQYLTNHAWRTSPRNQTGIRVQLPLEDYQFKIANSNTERNHLQDKSTTTLDDTGYFGHGIVRYKKNGNWKFINAAGIDNNHYLHGDMTADNAADATSQTHKVIGSIDTTQPMFTVGWYKFSNVTQSFGATSQEAPDDDSEIVMYFLPFASATTAIHDVLLQVPQHQYAGNIDFATDIKIVMNTSDLSYQIFRNSNVGATPNWVAVEDCYLSNQKVLP